MTAPRKPRAARPILTLAQVSYLEAETVPRWEHEPPQRESFDSDMQYTIALGAYADRCMAADDATPASRKASLR